MDRSVAAVERMRDQSKGVRASIQRALAEIEVLAQEHRDLKAQAKILKRKLGVTLIGLVCVFIVATAIAVHYEVTGNGRNLLTSGNIVYVLLILLAFFVFGCGFYSGRLVEVESEAKGAKLKIKVLQDSKE